MLTVQNDWIQYEPTPVRRTVVRGGASCAQRIPVASGRPRQAPPVTVLRGAAPVRPQPAGSDVRAARHRLRLTRRGRVVLALLPAIGAASLLTAWASVSNAQAAPPPTAAIAHHAAAHPE